MKKVITKYIGTFDYVGGMGELIIGLSNENEVKVYYVVNILIPCIDNFNLFKKEQSDITLENYSKFELAFNSIVSSKVANRINVKINKVDRDKKNVYLQKSTETTKETSNIGTSEQDKINIMYDYLVTTNKYYDLLKLTDDRFLLFTKDLVDKDVKNYDIINNKSPRTIVNYIKLLQALLNSRGFTCNNDGILTDKMLKTLYDYYISKNKDGNITSVKRAELTKELMNNPKFKL